MSNDAPTATVSGVPYAATEGIALDLKGTGLSVDDADSGGGIETATLSVGEGELTVVPGDSGVEVLGSGTTSVEIVGTIAQINALFGSGGTSTASFTETSSTPEASVPLTLAIEDNGNTGGDELTGSATGAITIIAVNNAPTFSVGDGVVTTAIGVEDDEGQSVFVQPDGKIVVVGYTQTGPRDEFALTRYNADGSLDTSFGNGGEVVTAVGSVSDISYTATLQPDGKIVLAGFSQDGSADVFALARYNADGSLDTSFGNGGTVTTAIGSGNDLGQSVTLQPDGKIVVAGYSQNGSGYDDFALTRYNADGSLDTSFGNGGTVTTTVASSYDIGQSVTLQQDGKIIVAGYIAPFGVGSYFELARYNADGSLDTSFGAGGKVTTAINSTADGYSVTLQPDGKIVVAGDSYNGSQTKFALARYNADGSLDTSFGNGGKVTTAFGTEADGGRSVTLQPDGKIVVAGYTFASQNDFALARYNADGSLDQSFGTGGEVTTAIGLGSSIARSVTLTPDGKIVVAGVGNDGLHNVFAVTRYNSDGSLDTTFNAADTLGGTVNYTRGGAAVVLDGGAQVFDAELAAANNYGGSTLTLVRDGGADVRDAFVGSGTLSLDGGVVSLGGLTVGSDTNAGGTLTITFNDGATQSDVASVLDQIAYSDTGSVSESPQIDFSFGDGNAGSQGTGGPLTATGAVTVDVLPANAAPSGTDGTVTTDENAAYYFSPSDFGFTDSDNNNLQAVEITTLPGPGSLTDDGSAVFAGQFIDVADLTNGLLVFTPGGNDSGNAYASFTFQVEDDGGTANGGVDTDPTPKTMTIDVEPPNQAPVASTPGSAYAAIQGVALDLTNTGLSVADADGGSGSETATLSVSVGVLTADAGDSGAVVLGSGTNSVTIEGTIDEIDALLEGGGTGTVSYLEGASAPDVALTLAIDDNGNTGTGGALTGSASTIIDVATADQAPSFVVGTGKVTTAISQFDDEGRAAVVQPDGKIVVAGLTTDSVTYVSELALVRYNPDGSVDTTFGIGGTASVPIGSAAEGDSVALQSDGKIVVAGYNSNGSQFEFALARFNADGSLDTSFGNDGTVSTPIGSSDDEGQSVTVQADGKIIVAGSSNNGSRYTFALVRYNTDGSLDQSFGNNGTVSTPIGSGDSDAESVTLQTDGKIIVAGYTSNGSTYDFALVRYNADGSLDQSFGINGKVSTPVGPSDDTAYSVALQTDGKIVVAGVIYDGSQYDPALVRYNADGSLDTSFGTGGKVIDSAVPVAQIQSAVIQADGKIVIAGYGFFDSETEFVLTRYNSDGSVDTGFGSNGVVTTPIGAVSAQAYSVTLQANGDLVVAGDYIDTTIFATHFAVVRYTADGTLDQTFGGTNTLGGTVSSSGTSSPVVLDATAQVFDPELGAANDYGGSTLTLARDGGANGHDVFAGSGTLSLDGGVVTLGGSTVGSDSNADGTLAITFDAGATQSQVTSVLDQIAYTDMGPASESPEIDFTFSDGNTGAQGAGGPMTTTGSVTVDFSFVNTAPTGADNTVTAIEATPYSFSAADFGFADANDNALAAVEITTLSGGSGSLSDNGIAVVAGQFVSVADINAGKLDFRGADNSFGANYSSFTFQVEDDGGRDNSGADTDPTPRTMTIDVIPLNQAPTATATSYAATEGVALDLKGTGLAVDDADSGGGTETATLSVGEGALTVTAGDSGAEVLGSGSTSVEIVGTIAEINALLESGGTGTVSFTDSAAVPEASVALTLAIEDNGNTGGGGELTGSASGAIAVTTVDNAPTFSVGDGVVTTAVGSVAEGRGVAVQPDGKIVVAGVSYNGLQINAALLRYNADGTLDTSFGSGGTVTTAIGSEDDGYSVSIQPDGKIVVAGGSNNGSQNEFAVTRYNADGSLDTSFGSGGTVTTAIGSDDQGYSVTLQPDGKIVVAGDSNNGSQSGFAVIRYNADGSLDTSFGIDGSVTTTIGSSAAGSGVIEQPDGKIVVAGVNTNGSQNEFALIRYNADGSLDTSFGRVTTAIDSGAAGSGLIEQPDGKIVVAGYSDNGSGEDFALARYNVDGSLDTSFGNGGTVTTAIGSGNDLGQSVTLQADGKIVVAGYSDDGGPDEFALARYNADGSLDTTFGSGGTVVTALGAPSEGYGVSVQPDGKIVVAGLGVQSEFAVARYNADGSLDTTFNAANTLGGTVGVAIGGPAVVLDSGAQVFDAELAAANNYGGSTLTLVRDGGADARDVFGSSGTLTLDGGVVSLGGLTVGSDSNAGGTLAITFADGVTQSEMASVLDQLTYSNIGVVADTPQIDFTFSDGNAGAQGTGGPLTATGSVAVNVVIPNSAPSGTSNTITTGEDTPLYFSSADFGFADSDGNNFEAVEITTLPLAGTLTDDGFAVTAGQFISPTDIDDANLIFTPADGASGNAYASFTFQVEDDGGTAFGGVDTDPTPRTMTINVQPFDNPPVLTGIGPGAVNSVYEQAGRLDSTATVSDADLDALNGGAGDYDGAYFYVLRQTGGGAPAPNNNDVFGLDTVGADFTLDQFGDIQVGGVTIGNFDPSGGTGGVSFGDGATTALVNEVLDRLTYKNTNATPPASLKLRYAFNDGNEGAQGAGSALDDEAVLQVDIDRAPVVTTSSGMPVFVSGNGSAGTPIAVDPGVTIGDPDGGVAVSATVSITDGFAAGEDDLGFTNSSAALFGNIASSYNSLTAVLTLSSAGGTATEAQWRAALRAVTYTDSAASPNAATRTISFVVNDGVTDSAAATRSIEVIDQPVAVATFTANQSALDALGNVAISDTAADILADLAALNGDVGNIASITVTGAPLVVGVSKFSLYEPALDKILGGFNFGGTAMAVSGDLDAIELDIGHINAIAPTGGVVTASVATFNADRTALDKIGGFTILDTADNVDSVAALVAETSDLANIGSIQTTDTQVHVGVGRFQVYEAALDKILGGFNFTGQAATISGDLDQIQHDLSQINSVAAYNGTVTASVATFTQDKGALDKIGSFAIVDNAADVLAGLATLSGDLTPMTAITVTGTPVVVGVGKFSLYESLLDKISGGFNFGGTALAVSGDLDAIQHDLGHINAIAPTGGVVTASVATFTADKMALDKIGSFAIVDNAATIIADLTALNGDVNRIASITVTGAPLVTGAGKFVPDQALFNKIVGGFGVNGVSGNLNPIIDALERDLSKINSVAFIDANPVLTLTSAQATNDAVILAKITSAYVENVTGTGSPTPTTTTGHGNGLTITPVAGGHDTITGNGSSEGFVFKPAFGQDTITDFASHLTGTNDDTITLPVSEFASFATMLSHAVQSNGNVTITAPGTPTDQLTLNNVTLATLNAHQGDFKFA